MHTICCLIYISIFIGNIFQEGPIVLADNKPDDKFIYLLTLYTGHQIKSGTTAAVSVVLEGEFQVEFIQLNNI